MKSKYINAQELKKKERNYLKLKFVQVKYQTSFFLNNDYIVN